MSESDLINLYSGQILALASAIPLQGQLDQPEGRAMKRVLVCGSQISVHLRLKDARISDFAQEVQACALGQAGAAILGQVVIGRSLPELETARAELAAMLAASAPAPQPPFDGYGILMAARDYPNRHGSILLALDATIEAIKSRSHPTEA